MMMMFRFASSKVQPVQKKTVSTLVVLIVIFSPIEDTYRFKSVPHSMHVFSKNCHSAAIF